MNHFFTFLILFDILTRLEQKKESHWVMSHLQIWTKLCRLGDSANNVSHRSYYLCDPALTCFNYTITHSG